jgi:hypothetical protein
MVKSNKILRKNCENKNLKDNSRKSNKFLRFRVIDPVFIYRKLVILEVSIKKRNFFS